MYIQFIFLSRFSLLKLVDPYMAGYNNPVSGSSIQNLLAKLATLSRLKETHFKAVFFLYVNPSNMIICQNTAALQN